MGRKGVYQRWTKRPTIYNDSLELFQIAKSIVMHFVSDFMFNSVSISICSLPLLLVFRDVIDETFVFSNIFSAGEQAGGLGNGDAKKHDRIPCTSMWMKRLCFCSFSSALDGD